jgi:hypothetical protein
MAVRFRAEFRSFGLPANGSRRYQVDIHDTSYSGAITTFDCTNLQFNYAGQEDDLFDPIATSTCNVTLLINTSTLNTFVTDLISADEGRFLIDVSANYDATQPNTLLLYWRGILQPDLVSVEMAPTEQGYEYSITATDGLARLKTIDYDDNGTPYDGRDQIRYQISKALNKIGTQDLYGSSDRFFGVIHSWFPNEFQGKSVTATFFTNIHWHHRIWRKVDRDGKIVTKSTYDVLKEICLAFGMKLRQFRGVYVFAEIGIYSQTNSLRIRYLTKDGTLMFFSIDTVADWAGYLSRTGTPAQFAAGTRQVMVAAGSEETYYPALRRSEVVYKHYSTQNLIAGGQWSSSLVADITIAGIDYNNGAVRLALSFGLTTRINDTGVTDYTQVTPIWLKFHVKVQLTAGATTYYLKRTSSFTNGNVVSGAMSWETGSANRYEFWVGPHSIDNAPYTNQISLVTIPLPASGDLAVNVTYFEAATLGGTLSPSGSRTITFATSSAYLEAFVDGVIENQYNYDRYEAINDNAGNSLETTLDVLIGDGPTLNAYSAMEVYNSTTLAWVVPTGWGRLAEATYTLKHGRLLAQERLRLQNKVIKRWTGTFYGEYSPFWLLQRSHDNARYIMQGARHDVKTETWSGTWVQIRYTPTGITNNPEETFVTNPGFAEDQDAPPGLQTGDTGLAGLIATQQPESAGQTRNTLPAFPVLTANAVPSTTTAIIESGDTINTIGAVLPEPYSYMIGDAITLVDPVSGISQEFEVEANQHDGTTAIDVASGTADTRFESGAFVSMPGDYALQLLQWARRKVTRIEVLPKFSVISAAVSPGITVDYGQFWRPDNVEDVSENKSTFFATRRINRIWLEIFNNWSNSFSITYEFEVYKNGTLIHTETFYGTTNFVIFKLPAAEQIIPSTATVYAFKMKGTRTSTAIAQSAGLVINIEVI